MKTKKACTCTHAPPTGFCCEMAELVALRAVLDHAITKLDSGTSGPLVLDDEGHLRQIVKQTTHTFRVVRSNTAA